MGGKEQNLAHKNTLPTGKMIIYVNPRREIKGMHTGVWKEMDAISSAH